LVIIFPSTDIIQLPLLPVIHVYIHTHTIKKKLGVLGTQIMIDKLFFKFPLKCMRNAEIKNWSFNLHLPQAYERAIGTLIEYRVIRIDDY